MKLNNKILVLGLALVLPLSASALAGEGASFETRMTRARELSMALQSYHMDMRMDMRMRMTVQGQSMDMTTVADYAADVEQNPLKMIMDLHMDVTAMGQHQEQMSRVFIVQDGDRCVTHLSPDGGKTWQKQSVPMPDFVKQTDALMGVWLDCADTFRETGTPMVNGLPAIEYKGELMGDFVQKSIELSGTLDSLGTLFDGGVPPDLFRNLGPIAVTVAFDEASGRAVYFEMEMSRAMDTLIQRLMASLAQSQSLGPNDLKMSVSLATFASTFSRFDEVRVVTPASIRD